MSKTIFKIITILSTAGLLAGCVIVINNGNPTQDEQVLMDIQGQASQQIAQINQKIQNGDYSVEQLQGLINEAKKVVDENLKKIAELKLPERARAMAEKTKEYLQKAEQTYQSFLQMSSQTNEKVQELVSNLKTMSEPLINMARQMEEMKLQFLNELLKATATK